MRIIESNSSLRTIWTKEGLKQRQRTVLKSDLGPCPSPKMSVQPAGKEKFLVIIVWAELNATTIDSGVKGEAKLKLRDKFTRSVQFDNILAISQETRTHPFEKNLSFSSSSQRPKLSGFRPILSQLLKFLG